MYDEWRDMGEASGLMALKQTEYYDGEEKHLKILEEHPDVSSLMCDDGHAQELTLKLLLSL